MSKPVLAIIPNTLHAGVLSMTATEENGTIYLLPASRFGNRELVEHVRDPVTNDRTGYFGDDPGDPGNRERPAA